MAHVEKRGSSRWRARYCDPYGRERSKTFYAQATTAADAAAAERLGTRFMDFLRPARGLGLS